MAENLSRRAFFQQASGRGEVRRPPWTGADFTDQCTRCNACIEACPEAILVRGDGGFPEINFDANGCTLCGDCVGACEEPVFDTSRPAFPWHAVIQSHCLALGGIHCQSCQDACDYEAIRFPPRLGSVPRPELDTDACVGCGACLPACPNNAITLEVANG